MPLIQLINLFISYIHNIYLYIHIIHIHSPTLLSLIPYYTYMYTYIHHISSLIQGIYYYVYIHTYIVRILYVYYYMYTQKMISSLATCPNLVPAYLRYTACCCDWGALGSRQASISLQQAMSSDSSLPTGTSRGKGNNRGKSDVRRVYMQVYKTYIRGEQKHFMAKNKCAFELTSIFEQSRAPRVSLKRLAC